MEENLQLLSPFQPMWATTSQTCKPQNVSYSRPISTKWATTSTICS